MWAVFFILGGLSITGCKKPDADLGLELLPGDELDVTGEPVPLRAYSFEQEQVRTSGLTRNLLGSYLDPQFGLVKTGIVTQLRLSSSNVGAGMDTTGLQPDSLVLSLVYDAAAQNYGGLGAQIFEVHELNEDLSVDSLYHTDDLPEVLPADLVADPGGSITPRPLEAVVIGGETLPPQLRIKLSNTLADRFLNAFNTPSLSDNTAFLQFFKGIHITVNNGTQLPFQEGILYFDLLHAGSKATLYYRDQNDQPDLQRKFDLPVTSNSVRYTTAVIDHSQAIDPSITAALADSNAVTDAVYIQTLGGSRVAVRLPDVQEFAGTDRILAKAELIAPVEGTFNPYLTPPLQIFLFRLDDEGEEIFLPDQLGGITAIDGTYRSDTREYRFNVTRYVQGLINGQIPNNGFEMVAGSSGISANRVVLTAPREDGSGMRLLLTFTTY